MSRKRRVFSAEFKTKVVLELLSGELTVAQVASKYEITAKSLGDWKKQFLANASLAFDVAGVTQAYKDHIEELQEENNDALAKKLGKTTIERDWAVGKLRSLDLSNKKGRIYSNDRLFCCAYLYDIEHSLVKVRFKLFYYSFI